ncbi:MAG: tetratricopeptide repeat protein [Arenimonas sp.]
MPQFFDRLRQRKMGQWALAYAAGAWVLLQVLGLAVDSYEWPRMVMRLGFGVVVLGFIVTLVLAWYHGERGEQKFAGTELLILALLLTVGGGVLWRVEHSSSEPKVAVSASAGPRVVDDANRKSIAVLPFANLSSDKDNAYFAEGIQDEILTRLANIGDLTVISRTSTLRFASRPDNLPDIARRLGVANIVEGSVQKVGDSVRINVQLIRADTDTHLWAEIYDRKLVDVFTIQSEVAAAIAQALQATLTRDEEQAVARKSTANTAAYDAYLKGLSIEAHANYSVEVHTRARDAFAEAVRLDPDFAEAWMHLVTVQSFMYFNDTESNSTALAAMKRGAETVARLRPDSGEAWITTGYYRYRGLVDYEGALEAFEKASLKLTNNAVVFGALGSVERRLGRFQSAIAHLERAEQLDPRNATWPATHAEVLAGLRRFPESRSMYDRALSLSPGDPSYVAGKAATFQAEGNLDAADAVLSSLPPLRDADNGVAFRAQADQLFFRRRFDTIIAETRAALSPEAHPRSGVAPLRYRLALARALRLKGDAAAARSEYQLAIAQATSLGQSGMGDIYVAAPWAEAQAGLGNKSEALAGISRAVVAERGDAKESPLTSRLKAAILVQFGDHDAAIPELTRLLEIPYGVTPAELRLDPLLDPIRKDPRFRKLSGEN